MPAALCALMAAVSPWHDAGQSHSIPGRTATGQAESGASVCGHRDNACEHRRAGCAHGHTGEGRRSCCGHQPHSIQIVRGMQNVITVRGVAGTRCKGDLRKSCSSTSLQGIVYLGSG
eukprot:365621-Chlamydomonas_euryale.AAC.15